MDYDSIINQDIKRKFVDREVIMNGSWLITTILSEEIISWEDIENIYDDQTDSYKEVYEWWFVSKMLYEYLREKGEVVCNFDGGFLWGRTSTGQAILLDEVISEICECLGILDGQEHSWA